MTQIRKSNFIKASVLLSIVSISISLLLNYQIAKEYLRVDGKTKLLFGIKELLQFGYQYYVVVPGLISLTLALLAIKSDNPKNRILIAILLSLIAITIVFARVWRLFV